MNRIMHELYTFEDKTSDEVLLINGFQHINQLIPYINDLQQENQSLKQQCEIVEKRLCDEYQDMLEKRNKLFVETSKLKDRIEKAIEYINKLKEYPYLERYYVGELLEILKGDK